MAKIINSDEICLTAVKGLQEKKGENICIIDMRELDNAFTDYFVICTGNSDTHLDSLGESAKKTLSEELGEEPVSLEGRTNREWILLDYGNLIIHIFKEEKRSFYGLEDLWGDAKITYIED